MGTSNWQNISYNIELVRKLDPRSILDVGAGFGRWGFLFREFLEIWDTGRYDGNWERTIDAIEIYPGYVKEYHKYFYNEVYITDASEFMTTTDKCYDLINFGDVIEHMEKEKGEELIKLALTRCKCALINIPIGKYWPQEAADENPYEAHRSIWYNNDFTKYKYYRIKTFYDIENREFSVILVSNSKIEFTKKYGKFFKLKNFLKHRLGLKKLIEGFEKKRR
ncbi:MAG: class I SAM-dependent methyltransferase [Ignavibacteria bacterium]|nr:class I SAM-dependent methyltransferase [Ignavibacteria bacterium]